MRSQTNWLLTILGCVLLGVAIGYIITLLCRPQLLPRSLRFGNMQRGTAVLLLGVDVVYSGARSADKSSFQGRSDTIMLSRFDPERNQFYVLSIPRDTNCEIPGYGRQKINGANALGGEPLAMRTVERLTSIHCDHYVVLNVHGLVELVDALGGITINIPKRMRYHDRAARLKINLDSGPSTLNGTEAMGFVRFRHDALGDIGRVQRQELFIQAVMDKTLSPASWARVPQLLQIAAKHVKTDLKAAQIMEILNFVRAVPKDHQHMVMLPGNFSGTGDWSVDAVGLKKVTASMLGQMLPSGKRSDLKISIENASSSPVLATKLAAYFQRLGYPVVACSSHSSVYAAPQAITKIIAERGNQQDANLLQSDLKNQGEIVNASIGDIHSYLTVVAGDDVIPLMEAAPNLDRKRQRRH